MKTCSKCRNEYPLSSEHWHKDSRSKDGFTAQCAECRRNYSYQYYKEHPEKKRESDRKHYAKNSQKIIRRNVVYQQRNAAKVYTKNKLWVSRNRKVTQGYYRNYYQSHKDRFIKKRQQRRSREFNADGGHTFSEVLKLFRVQEGYCFHCGCDLIPVGFHEDHWIPLSRGGSDYIENIRLLCKFCNLSKGSKLPSEWSYEYA